MYKRTWNEFLFHMVLKVYNCEKKNRYSNFKLNVFHQANFRKFNQVLTVSWSSYSNFTFERIWMFFYNISYPLFKVSLSFFQNWTSILHLCKKNSVTLM